MKITHLIVSVSMFAVPALAQQSAGEKVKVVAKDAARTVKKGVHRVEETLCTDSKAVCASKKVANRVEETKDVVKDKASEVKDELDRDAK